MGNRKFFLTVFASACASLFCWYGRLDGHQWLDAQVLILGMYKVANVVDKKLGGAG